VALTTLAFVGMHLAAYWGAPALFLLEMTVAWSVLGFFCGWITARCGTLWPAVLVHTLYDVAYMIKYFSEM
jgi:hypothetical protein